MEAIVVDDTAGEAADWAAAAEGVADGASVDGVVADGDAIGGRSRPRMKSPERGKRLKIGRAWRKTNSGAVEKNARFVGKDRRRKPVFEKIREARAKMVFLPRRLHEFQRNGRFVRSVRENCNHCAAERREIFTAPVSEERIKERVSKKKLYFTPKLGACVDARF
ncbi:hypothetical protein C2845_PM09G06450 [Panicum miliaceum]|uniref:Uncharacterized protein n=1 Tax=Panicum miliaceum TaxID=4540 RepID=A0A3L6RZF0_PANMI|nr:hypothetical protein C2845_PM09G06450 [Panicum miliaceum]